MIGQFGLCQLRHACVKIEVALGKGNVDVAAFADRLAIVERFQNGEQAGVFLQEAGNGVKVLGAAMTAEPFPFRLGLAGGGDGGVDLVLRGLAEVGQGFAIGGVARLEVLARRGPLAVDILAKGGALVDDPGKRVGGGFRGGAILHGLEDFLDGHTRVLRLWRGVFIR